MKRFTVILSFLLMSGLVYASDVNVSVDVTPPVRTFSTIFPIGALLFGILTPLILARYGMRFLEIEVMSIRGVFKMIFFFVSLVISAILFYYLVYFLNQPI